MITLYKYYSNFVTRFAEHDCNNVFNKAIRDLKEIGFEGIDGKDILDLGCGQRYQLSLQLAADGAKVTATDINYIKPELLPMSFYHTMRCNGLKRAIKSTIRKIIFDNKYYKALESFSGKSLYQYRNQINFLLADNNKPYPITDNSFDLIISIAVLEHVVDVPSFALEIKRLLKPNGYFYSIIHKYYSLSGGHHPEWAFPDEHPSKNVPPWDHLRKNLCPASVYLNKLKPKDYRNIFSRHLKIINFETRDINHDKGNSEGATFLTKEILKEMPDYPRELLLNRAWCIICHKTLD